MDRNLRDLLDLAVGEPPRWVNLEAVRRQAIRRRATQTGFAGLAVIVAAGLALGVSAGTVRSGSPPAQGGHQTAGPPPYYVLQLGSRQPLQVRATATGKVTATVPQPKGLNCGEGNAGYAATDNETIFLLCTLWKTTATKPARQPGPHRPASKITTLDTFVYRFGISRAGRVTGFSLVKGSELKGELGDDIAVTPDGSEIAVEVTKPPKTGPFYTNTITEGIFVINLKTGQRALWHTGPYVPGAIQYAYASSISFPSGGKELVVQESRCHRTRKLINCNGNAEEQVRAYSPAVGGGSLEQGQVLVNRKSLSDAFINPAGSALTEELLSCPKRGICTLTVERLPLRDRHPVILYQTRTGTPFAGVFDRFMAVDPSGRFVIIDASAGAKDARVNGWIRNGRLVPLSPPNGNAPIYEAW
jgi:hypothetical protein